MRHIRQRQQGIGCLSGIKVRVTIHRQCDAGVPGQLLGDFRMHSRLRQIADDFKERLERLQVTGSSGGGAVCVTVNGHMTVTDVELGPALAAALSEDESSRELAQQLIGEATNDALEHIRALIQSEAQQMADELGLPTLPGLAPMLN